MELKVRAFKIVRYSFKGNCDMMNILSTDNHSYGLLVCNSVCSQGFKVGLLLKYNHDGNLIYIFNFFLLQNG